MLTNQHRKRRTIVNFLSLFKRWQILSAIFIFFSAAYSPAQTIEEYNAKIDAEKKAAYEDFSHQWQNFLTGQTQETPRPLSPALARKSTEEYLTATGGLKKVFAEASRKNTYGFTFKRPADDPLRTASFHRGYNSIFIDVQNIPSNDWLLRFVHEVSHSLDSELYNSIDIYNNEALFQTLNSWGQQGRSLNELSPELRKQLDTWLMAGLSRGFLGEYRAWLATMVLYEEGLKDGTFKEFEWLEEIKKSRPPEISMRVHLLRFLSPSWEDPKKEIFSHAFIQQALKELRQKLVDHPERIPLGNLGQLLHLK